MKNVLLLTAITLTPLLLPTPTHAQNFSIDWYKIAGGGGTSAEQTYSLTGAIGQPDAGTLTGASFTLEGGFFPGIIVPSETGAPTLYIQQQTAGALTISWTPATSGFLLEETTDLTTPFWSTSTPGNPTTPIPATGQTKYYRLRKP
jgi:hypothetical protein